MKKIIIHCGIPKTGSSALQVAFAKNMDALISEIGIYYPPLNDIVDAKQGKISSGNAYILAASYFDSTSPLSLSNKRPMVLSALEKAVEKSPCDIQLSSEHFSQLTHNGLSQLLMDIKNLGEINLVYFIRNQYDLWNSNYIQTVKRGLETRSPSEFFQFHFDGFQSQHQYFKRFQKILSILPANAKLTLIQYEALRSFNGGIFNFFLSNLGLRTDLKDFDIKVNRSLTSEEVNFFLNMNKISDFPHISDFLIENTPDIKVKNTCYIPMEKIELFKEAFREDNRNLFFEFFKNSDNQYEFKGEHEFFNIEESISGETIARIMSSYILSTEKRLQQIQNSK